MSLKRKPLVVVTRRLPDAVETIDDEVDRLTDLVTNLLAMSRLQAGATDPSMSEADVGEVLLREGRQADPYAGQIDVPARREGAGDHDPAADGGGVAGDDLEADEAVVDQHGGAGGDVVDEARVIDGDGADVPRAVAGRAGGDGEIEEVARGEQDGLGEFPGADLGALDVHHDRDLALEAPGNLADAASADVQEVLIRHQVDRLQMRRPRQVDLRNFQAPRKKLDAFRQ